MERKKLFMLFIAMMLSVQYGWAAYYPATPSTNMTASCESESIDKIVDGNYYTRFSSQNEQNEGDYVTLDLLSINPLSNIEFYSWGGRPHKAKISISDDNVRWSDLTEFTKEDASPLHPYGYTYNATGTSARYVKMEIIEINRWALDVQEFRAEIPLPAPERTITLEANSDERGTVTGGGTHSGAMTCIATVNPGYALANWTNKDDGKVVSTSPTYIDNTAGNKTYIANFGYPVSAIANHAEGGNVTISADGALEGTTVGLTAIAVSGSGYVFENWTVDGVEVSRDANFTSAPITAPTEFVANFKMVNYPVTPSTNIPRIGTSIEKVVDGNIETYYEGYPEIKDYVTLDLRGIKPLSNINLYNLHFDKAKLEISDDKVTWKTLEEFSNTTNYSYNAGGESARYVKMELTGNPFYFKMGEFQLELCVPAPERTITLEANPAKGGALEGGGTKAGPMTCIATANPGYALVNWTNKDDSKVVSTSPTYIDNTAGNKTYIANFWRLHAVSATANPAEGGNVTISADGALEGTTVDLTAIVVSGSGYVFENWTVDGVEVSRDANFTSAPITAPTGFVANFKMVNYPVTPSTNMPSIGIEKVVDGNIETYYERYQEYSVVKDYVMLDLRGIKPLSNINLYNLYFGKAKLKISDDNVTWKTLEEFSNTTNYSYNAGGESARYVKMELTEACPSSYFKMGEFQLHIPSIAERTVTLEANPAECGNVTGGGTHFGPITCTATANKGYAFANWTNKDDGTVVSTSPTYIDYTAGDKTYIANFGKAYEVSAIAIPEEGGSVTISTSEILEDKTVDLTATSKIGYGFVNWMVQEIEVSRNPNYTSSPISRETEFAANFKKIYPVIPLSNMSNYPPYLNKMADDKFDTYFGSEYYQEVGDYVMLDLGGVNPLSKIELYFTDTLSRRPARAKLSISDDNKEWRELVLFPNADISTTYPYGYIYDATGNSARYVKMEITKANVDRFEITEFRVEIPIPAQERTVTLEANPAEWGIVKGGGTKVGRITCEATANLGYGFANWTDKSDGKVVHASSTYVDNTPGDKTYIANFGRLHAVSATANVSERGSVTISAKEVAEGGSVSLTATATIHYVFVNWTVNGVEVSREANFTSGHVTAATEFVANFLLACYPATPSSNMTPAAGCPLESIVDDAFDDYFWSKEIQEEGQYVTLDLKEVKPLSNIAIYFSGEREGRYLLRKAKFSISENNTNWTDLVDFYKTDISTTSPYGYIYDATGASARYVKMEIIEVNSAATKITEFRVEPPFPERSITLEANPVRGGALTGGGTKPGPITCTATANTYYEFVNWTDKADGTVASSSTTFVDRTRGNRTYVANFLRAEGIHDVSAVASPAEGGRVTPSQTEVEDGKTVDLTVTEASANYSFINWTVNGVEVSKSESFTSLPITEKTDFVANFKLRNYIATPSTEIASFGGRYSIESIADGNFTTAFQSSVEQKVGDYIILDIGESKPLSNINLYFHKDQWTHPYKAKLLLSDDKKGWRDLSEFIWKDVSITPNYGFYFYNATGESARYIKMEITEGRYANHYIYEFTLEIPALERTITLKANPVEGGDVTGGGRGAGSITCTATAKTGYEFINWTNEVGGAVVSTSTTFIDDTSSDQTYAANFHKKQDLDITTDKTETSDSNYANVTISKGEREEPKWTIGDYHITVDQLELKIDTDGSTPQIDIIGGSLSSPQVVIKREVTAGQWALISLPFAINLNEVEVDGKPAIYGDNIKMFIYDADYRAKHSREGVTVSGWKEYKSGSIPQNKGFAVAINESKGAKQTVSFKSAAKAFDGTDKSISLARYPSTVNEGMDADWNFYGTPQLLSTVKDEGYSLYLYDPATNGYEEISSAETATYVPFTSWFVQSANDFNSMNFRRGKPVEKSVGNIGSYDKQILTINGNEDEARVILYEGSSMDYVKNEDAMHFAPLNQALSQIYLIDHNNLKIAASVVPAVYKEVRLGFKAGKAGAQTITLSRALANSVVYLIDNQQSKTVQLNEGGSYTFNSTAGINESRFTVKTIISPTGVDQADGEGGNIRVTVIGDDIKIIGAVAGEKVTISTTGGINQEAGFTTEGITTVNTNQSGALIVTVGNEVVKVSKQ